MIGHWEIILLLLAVVLLFGSGRISALMGDVAKGIKSFKTGLKDDDAETKASLESATKNDDNTHTDKTNS